MTVTIERESDIPLPFSEQEVAEAVILETLDYGLKIQAHHITYIRKVIYILAIKHLQMDNVLMTILSLV